MSAGEPLPTAPVPALDTEALRIGHKLREVGRALDARFLDKGELIRLLLVTLVAGEHMLIVGPPGTAKSALVRQLARLIGATNEVPNDDALAAVFDRFLVRASSENLDSFHFHGLVERGIRAEIEALRGEAEAPSKPLVSLADIRALQARLSAVLQFPE